MSRRVRLTLEAPGSVVTRTLDEEFMRQTAIEFRAQVLDGTMPQATRDILMNEASTRDLLKMWDDEKAFLETSRVNQVVRLNKIRQRLWSLLKGGLVTKTTGRDCLNVRSKHMKAFKKLKKRFIKTGGGIVGWEALVNDVCLNHGLPHMYSGDE